MKILKTIVIAVLLIIGQTSFAQDKSYKEMVVENPTAEEDIKVVDDFIDALTANKMDKVASLLTDTYVGAGPAHEETQTKAEYLESWKKAHEVRTNQKNDFIRQTFRVLEGDLKGDWVSVWGNYIFTENGITVNLPYQSTLMVDNGKIARSIIYFDRLAVLTAMGYELTKK